MNALTTLSIVNRVSIPRDNASSSSTQINSMYQARIFVLKLLLFVHVIMATSSFEAIGNSLETGSIHSVGDVLQNGTQEES